MNEKLKRRILFEAAKLMQTRKEQDYQRARIRAARAVSRGWVHPSDLPDKREIHDVLQQISSGGWPKPSGADSEADRFAVFRSLLVPLESVQQHRRRHPEGDVLYHSLQVFELVCEQLPYDEEVLLAALLHDVGRGIDPQKHVEAALNALSGLISERTAWLLENYMLARGIVDATIGARARRRLAGSEWFEELEILARADLDGRQAGARVRDLDEVLDYIQGLAEGFE